MERRKLLGSQRELLLLKKEKRDSVLERLDDGILKTITSIAKEQGILEAELDQWVLNEEAEYFEKKE